MSDGVFDNVAVTGPGALALGILGWLLKVYLDTRKTRREDIATERSSETGIVETTKSLSQLMREHLASVNQDLVNQTDLRRKFEAENALLRRENEDLRIQLGVTDEVSRYRRGPAPTGYDNPGSGRTNERPPQRNPYQGIPTPPDFGRRWGRAADPNANQGGGDFPTDPSARHSLSSE